MRRASRRVSVLHRKLLNRPRCSSSQSRREWCSTWRVPIRVSWTNTWAACETRTSVISISPTLHTLPSCYVRSPRLVTNNPRVRWIRSRARRTWPTRTRVCHKTWATMKELSNKRRVSIGWAWRTKRACHSSINPRWARTCSARSTRIYKECRVVH